MIMIKAPFGIFWRYGEWKEHNWYFHITNKTIEALNRLKGIAVWSGGSVGSPSSPGHSDTTTNHFRKWYDIKVKF